MWNLLETTDQFGKGIKLDMVFHFTSSQKFVKSFSYSIVALIDSMLSDAC